ncbi:L,D-transpeptidase family protein [Anaeromyxobacter oryzae]|uniref:Lipoprotein n=1 Tax=Anaeromyxobacter oryzae TaxID=2918170 RepID=A0ABM7WWK9_9BACT|nr:hypothetical protein [Anaeromyxobacter oryzae]BDG03878.1 hypothetical protein AMOR_28740 [Anaeromyxobacter oryzae]
MRRLLLVLLAATGAACFSHDRAELYRGAALSLSRRPTAASPAAVAPGDSVVLRMQREGGSLLEDATTGQGLYVELDPARLRPGATLALPADARRMLAWTAGAAGARAAEDADGTLALEDVSAGEVRGRLRLRSAALGLLVDREVTFRAEPLPPSPAAVAVPDTARQLLVVVADAWETADARAYRFERDAGGPWRLAGRPVRAMIGRGGLAWGLGLHPDPPPPGPVKHEGDGRAPAGAFSIGIAFGDGTVPEPEGRPFLLTRPESVCVDDPASPRYNTIGREDREHPPRSAERMLRDDGLYRIGVVVEHNHAPAVAGRGSCVFLHVWRRPGEPTSGSTTFGPGDAEVIVPWLGPGAVLVQLPRAEYEALAGGWRLPPLP